LVGSFRRKQVEGAFGALSAKNANRSAPFDSENILPPRAGDCQAGCGKFSIAITCWKLYNHYSMKITAEVMREARRKLAAAGGRARAKKYGKKALSKWGKKGGRPRKKKEGVR
jgi:hypothetical protein